VREFAICVSASQRGERSCFEKRSGKAQIEVTATDKQRRTVTQTQTIQQKETLT